MISSRVRHPVLTIWLQKYHYFVTTGRIREEFCILPGILRRSKRFKGRLTGRPAKDRQFVRQAQSNRSQIEAFKETVDGENIGQPTFAVKRDFPANVFPGNGLNFPARGCDLKPTGATENLNCRHFGQWFPSGWSWFVKTRHFPVRRLRRPSLTPQPNAGVERGAATRLVKVR